MKNPSLGYPLNYYFAKSSRGGTISPEAERALAPHGFDLRAGRALGRRIPYMLWAREEASFDCGGACADPGRDAVDTDLPPPRAVS
jgi:hypothetical protein